MFLYSQVSILLGIFFLPWQMTFPFVVQQDTFFTPMFVWIDFRSIDVFLTSVKER